MKIKRAIFGERSLTKVAGVFMSRDGAEDAAQHLKQLAALADAALGAPGLRPLGLDGSWSVDFDALAVGAGGGGRGLDAIAAWAARTLPARTAPPALGLPASADAAVEAAAAVALRETASALLASSSDPASGVGVNP